MKSLTKKVLKLSLSTVLLFGFTACAASCGNGSSTSDSIELWAGGQWTGSDLANLKTFISEYNTTHDTKVNVTSKTEFESSFATAVQVGRQPDVVIWDRFNTPTWGSQGFLYPLDNLLKEDNIDSSIFQEQAYDELNYGNVQYGLPLDLDIWGIYVNTDMLNDYNTKNPTNQAVIPTTWEELEDTAKKLTVKDSSGNITTAGYSSEDMYEHYIKYFISTGGKFMDSENKYPDYTSQEAKDTLTFLRQIYQDNVCTTKLNSKESFKNLHLAMINQPVYYSSYLKQYAPDLNYKFIPTPKYTKGANGKRGGMIGGYGLALPNALEKYQTDSWKAKQKKAWTFMKNWLTDYDTQLRWSEISNTLPALKSVYSSDWVQNTQVLKDAASYAPNCECRPSLAGFYYIQVNSYDTNMKSYIEADEGDASWSLDKIVSVLTSDSKNIVDTYSK